MGLQGHMQGDSPCPLPASPQGFSLKVRLSQGPAKSHPAPESPRLSLAGPRAELLVQVSGVKGDHTPLLLTFPRGSLSCRLKSHEYCFPTLRSRLLSQASPSLPCHVASLALRKARSHDECSRPDLHSCPFSSIHGGWGWWAERVAWLRAG